MEQVPPYCFSSRFSLHPAPTLIPFSQPWSDPNNHFPYHFSSYLFSIHPSSTPLLYYLLHILHMLFIITLHIFISKLALFLTHSSVPHTFWPPFIIQTLFLQYNNLHILSQSIHQFHHFLLTHSNTIHPYLHNLFNHITSCFYFKTLALFSHFNHSVSLIPFPYPCHSIVPTTLPTHFLLCFYQSRAPLQSP